MAAEALDPRRVIDEALQNLRDGLGPFVVDALTAVYGAAWWERAVEIALNPRDLEVIRRRHGSGWEALTDAARIDLLDVRNLLDVIERSWRDVFAGRLGRPARSYLGECRYIRDEWAHDRRSRFYTLDDVARALETMYRLLRLCSQSPSGAPRSRQALDRILELKRLVDQRRSPDTVSAHGPRGAEMTYETDPEPPETTVQLPLRSAYGFAAVHGLEAEASRIRNAPVPEKIHPSVFRRAQFADLFEKRDLLEKFTRERWPYGRTTAGQQLLRRYRRLLAKLPAGGNFSPKPAAPTEGPRSGKTLVVLFDGAVLRPEGRVDLEPNVRYRVTVLESLEPPIGSWADVEALIGTIEGPEDWAKEHDHYLYGGPKKGNARRQ